MSQFHEVAKAIQDNPELKEQIVAASSPAERTQLLKDNGITVPTQQDVQDHIGATLSEAVGGEGNTTLGAQSASAAAQAA